MEKEKSQIIQVNMLAWRMLENMIKDLESKYETARKDAPDDPELQNMLCELSGKINQMKQISLELGMCFVKLGDIDLSKF